MKRKLPAVTRANLWYCIILAYLIFNALYLCAAVVAVRPVHVLPPTALDLAVPFVAASIWVYLSQFLLVPWALATADNDTTRSRVFYSLLLATLLSLPVFVLYPTSVAHPPAPENGLVGFAWHTLRMADTPNNAFPSLHVALATLAGIALWKRRQRLVALIWPGSIALSTLTTRQHVSWDIAGGLVVAVLAWYLTPRLVPYERTPPYQQDTRAAPGRTCLHGHDGTARSIIDLSGLQSNGVPPRPSAESPVATGHRSAPGIRGFRDSP